MERTPVIEGLGAGCSELPPTSTELAVARMWSELLQRDGISRHDNFFDLGGDSMKMMIVHFRVGEELGVDLPPTLLIEFPRLADFCGLVDRLQAAHAPEVQL